METFPRPPPPWWAGRSCRVPRSPAVTENKNRLCSETCGIDDIAQTCRATGSHPRSEFVKPKYILKETTGSIMSVFRDPTPTISFRVSKWFTFGLVRRDRSHPKENYEWEMRRWTTISQTSPPPQQQQQLSQFWDLRSTGKKESAKKVFQVFYLLISAPPWKACCQTPESSGRWPCRIWFPTKKGTIM